MSADGLAADDDVEGRGFRVAGDAPHHAALLRAARGVGGVDGGGDLVGEQVDRRPRVHEHVGRVADSLVLGPVPVNRVDLDVVVEVVGSPAVSRELVNCVHHSLASPSLKDC